MEHKRKITQVLFMSCILYKIFITLNLTRLSFYIYYLRMARMIFFMATISGKCTSSKYMFWANIKKKLPGSLKRKWNSECLIINTVSITLLIALSFVVLDSYLLLHFIYKYICKLKIISFTVFFHYKNVEQINHYRLYIIQWKFPIRIWLITVRLQTYWCSFVFYFFDVDFISITFKTNTFLYLYLLSFLW